MKLFPSMLLVAGLAVGCIAYGQSPSQPTAPQSDSGKMTVTGCLTKGASAGQYTMTDQKTGEKTSIAGPDELDKYVNKTVQLIGTLSTQGQEKVFKPESVSQVSASCEKSK